MPSPIRMSFGLSESHSPSMSLLSKSETVFSATGSTALIIAGLGLEGEVSKRSKMRLVMVASGAAFSWRLQRLRPA